MAKRLDGVSIRDIDGPVKVDTAAMKPIFTRPGTAGESTKMVGVQKESLRSLLGSEFVDDEETDLWKKSGVAHCAS